MQLLLTDYLDIQNSVSEAHQMPATFADQSSNISSHFARRRQTSRFGLNQNKSYFIYLPLMELLALRGNTEFTKNAGLFLVIWVGS